MKPTTRTIDEILDRFSVKIESALEKKAKGHGDYLEVWKFGKETAKQDLLSTIKAGLPEKRSTPKVGMQIADRRDEFMNQKEMDIEDRAYDKALKAVEDYLDSLFEVKNG